MERFGYSPRQKALGAVVSAVFLLQIAVWLVAWSAGGLDYALAAFLTLVALTLGVWMFRSYITLDPDHVTIVNMRTQRIAYRDIAAVDVDVLRSPVVQLRLKEGRTVTIGPTAGLDVDGIALAIRARLPNGDA